MVLRTAEKALRGSNELQFLEVFDFRAQHPFDSHVQRQVRTRTSRAHADESHAGDLALHLDEFDVAAIGLHHGSYALQYRFYSLLE
jgi:hypothetical protein